MMLRRNIIYQNMEDVMHGTDYSMAPVTNIMTELCFSW